MLRKYWRVTAITIALLSTSGFSTAARAQDTKGSPECASIKDGIKAIQCEIRQLDKRIDAATATAACTDYLVAAVKDGRFKKEAILETAGGRLTKDNACTIAKVYGYAPQPK